MKNFIKKVFAGLGTLAALAVVGYFSNVGVETDKKKYEEKKPEIMIAFSYNEKDPVQVKMAMLGRSAMETTSSYYGMEYAKKIAKLAMGEDATGEAKIVAVNILMFIAMEVIDSEYYRNEINNLALKIE